MQSELRTSALVSTDRTFRVYIHRVDPPLELHARELRRARSGAGDGGSSDGNGTGAGLTVLLVHGMCQTHAFFDPLAERLLARCPRVERTVAVDLPGHGASPCPEGVQLGALGLGAYRDVVAQAMEQLGRVDVIVGHSMGGVIVQMIEQSLLHLGTSMARRFGTRAVALLGSTLPEELPWDFADGIVLPASPVSELLVKMIPFVKRDAVHGLHARMTDDEFIERFYTDRRGRPVPGRPSPAALATLNAPESFAAAAEMGGLDLDDGIFERPHVRRGLMAEYRVGVAAFGEDLYLTPAEEHALAAYVTGRPDARAHVVEDRDAVHCAPWSSPDTVVPFFTALLEGL